MFIKMEDLKKREMGPEAFLPGGFTDGLDDFLSDDVGLDLDFLLSYDFVGAEEVPFDEVDTPRQVSPATTITESNISPTPSHHRSYRDYALARWREKRKHRVFGKRSICKARSDVAVARPREGGRFVKSRSEEFISITNFQ